MPKARRSRPGLVITTTNIIITTITAMGMRMAESALYDLLSWMSPSYPIGAFAHSSGLEWAVEAGHANDRMSAQGWIDAMIVHGAIRADAILRSEEHTSELPSLMRISYAVFCLKKKNNEYIGTDYQRTDQPDSIQRTTD